MRRLSALPFGCCFALLCSGGPAWAAFTITLDYTHDDAGFGFFPADSDQRAALEAAAAAINAVLGTSLGDITNDPHETVTVVQGIPNTIRINPSIIYTNPNDGTTETFNPVSNLGTDEFRLYVGGRVLNNSSGGASNDTLAQGGRGAPSVSFAGSSGHPTGWIEAMQNAEQAFNAEYERGGPIMDTISGSLTLSSTPPVQAPFDLSFGPTVGNLWFDIDTDNDSVADSAGQLDNWWHYDHTSSVQSGQFDVYTVALHEILHAIGFGTSEAFDDNITGGNDWTGAAVIAEVGTGTNVLDSDSSHISGSLTSTRFVGGGTQSPVMLPSIGTGERRELTNLDVAFLSDMGFTLIPEPGTFLALAPVLLISAAGIRRRPRRA